MRTAYLDPDYRKDPTSDFFCVRCQRSLNGKAHRWVYIHPDPNMYMNVVHPEDAKGLKPEPVGMDCAKIIGIEFTVG